MGCPPTDLNARTGEFTPPGISFWAAAKICSDWVVLIVVLTKVVSVVGRLKVYLSIGVRLV
jgi:hypothetical protein